MLLPKKTSFVLRQIANLRIGSRAKISSCFQLWRPVVAKNVCQGFKVGIGSRASIHFFSMADTTSSFNVILRTYKLASTIFTLKCFAASSQTITKSSIDLQNAMRSVTPLSRCLSHVKKSTATLP